MKKLKMNKKTAYWAGSVILILIIGIVLIKKAKNKDANLPTAKKYAIVVTTIKPEMKEVSLSLPYLAITKNDKDVKLASKVTGRLEYIKSSGSKVKMGEVIARIDIATIESNINSVKSQLSASKEALKNLQATHKRTLELLKVKGASIEQSQKEETGLAGLEAKVESLEQKLNELNNTLSYAIIKSPVNGRISNTLVNKGDMCFPGHPVAMVSANNGFYLLLRVPTDLKIYSVVLNKITYEAIPLNSTFNSLAEYKVYVNSNNMTSGDRIELNVVVYKGKAIKLPFDAILNRNGKDYVLVQQGNKAVAKQVNIIQSGQEGVVVVGSTLEGKNIVVAKQDILLKLLSGISLKVKED